MSDDTADRAFVCLKGDVPRYGGNIVVDMQPVESYCNAFHGNTQARPLANGKSAS